ncbi:MAG: helix-turn-helix domain-containing protein [Pseudonocardia sp.]
MDNTARKRIRAAIVAAAMELFEHRGYDGKTVADIVETADIGTRTFFNYFTSKAEVVFPDADLRVRAAVDAIALGSRETPPRTCCCAP